MRIHIVKKGDTLYQLSKKYHVNLDKLIEMNPQIADPNKLDIGMKVKIPSSGAMPEPPAESIAHKHVVKQGDTLWKLSKQWGIPLQTMIDANPQLKNPSILMTGQVINIPKVNEHGQMEMTASQLNVQQQSLPPNKKNTAPITVQEEENIEPLQEEEKEELKEEIKEAVEEAVNKSSHKSPEKINKPIQESLEDGIVENIKENIKEQVKEQVKANEKSTGMNVGMHESNVGQLMEFNQENLPVLPELQANVNEMVQEVQPLNVSYGEKKKHHTSGPSPYSYTEHPFQQYNVPATQAYAAYPVEWYPQHQPSYNNLPQLHSESNQYAAMNAEAPAKKKGCGCGGSKSGHKSHGMPAPYSHENYPGLSGHTVPYTNAFPHAVHPYSAGWENSGHGSHWMPVQQAAGWENSGHGSNWMPMQQAAGWENMTYPANTGAVPNANEYMPYSSNMGAVPYSTNAPTVPYGANPWMNTSSSVNSNLSGAGVLAKETNEKAHIHQSGTANTSFVSPAGSNVGAYANSPIYSGQTAYANNAAGWGGYDVIPYATPIGGDWGHHHQMTYSSTPSYPVNTWAQPAPGTVFPNVHQQQWAQENTGAAKKTRDEEFTFADSEAAPEEKAVESREKKQTSTRGGKRKTKNSGGKAEPKASLHSLRTSRKSQSAGRRSARKNPWINY